MNLKYLAAATAASALLGGAAYAQQPATTPAPETPEASAESSTSVQTTTDQTSATTSTSVTTTAPAATEAGAPVSVTTTLVTNGPVPDTAENRAKYGQPMSRAGKRTAPAGN